MAQRRQVGCLSDEQSRRASVTALRRADPDQSRGNDQQGADAQRSQVVNGKVEIGSEDLETP